MDIYFHQIPALVLLGIKQEFLELVDLIKEKYCIEIFAFLYSTICRVCVQYITVGKLLVH